MEEKQYTKKRKYATKRGKREYAVKRTKPGTSIVLKRVGYKSNAISPKKMITWRNPAFLSFGGAVATYVTDYYVLNSLYDPYRTGAAATQPAGYDQYCPNLYNYYKVLSGSLVLRLKALETTNAQCKDMIVITWINLVATAPTDIRDALVQPGAKIYTVHRDDDSTKLFKPLTVCSSKFKVSDYMEKDQYTWVESTASPTVGAGALIFHWYMQEWDGAEMSATDDIAVIAEIVQVSEMIQRGAVPES